MRRRFSGFSLIELMIAVTLGMLAIAAVGSVFIYGSRNYKQDDKVSRMQDELRFAMAQLTQDLEMAGFWAQIRSPLQDIDLDSSATVSTDCGPTTDGGTVTASNNWVYNERRAGIATLGDATASGAAATFPCISADEFVAGTDIIGIKRIAGAEISSPENKRIYLRTNGVQNTLYKHSSTPPAPSGTICPATNCTVSIYEYRPSVWYIRKYAVDGQSPAVPSLCRKYLQGGDTPQMTAECLAQGIVDMQLEFGFDNNADGVADYFVEYAAAPAPDTVLARVVAVRVHLLARSSAADVGYVNQKTYQLASQTRGPFNDGFYRKAISATVLLRNHSYRLAPYNLPSN